MDQPLTTTTDIASAGRTRSSPLICDRIHSRWRDAADHHLIGLLRIRPVQKETEDL